MAEHVVDLKLDRSLIDSQFDGYKLSLDSLPIYETTLEKGPDVVKLTEEQHSYQHLRAFGLTNHIISDPWDQNSAYIVTESWDVVKVSISLESSPEATVSVFTIPEANETRQKVGRHNVSVNFVSEELAVLADGAGTLFIIDTGIRTENKEPWTIKHQCVPLDNKKPFVLTYSAVKPSNVSPCIECVALHVEETADERKGNSAPFETLLEWLSFAQDDKKEWRLSRTRSLVCARCPEYVSIDVKSDALLLTSQKPARLIYDSLKPVTPPTEGATESKEDSGPEYTWSQTAEDVTVLFTVPSSVGKADIYMSLHPAQIEFGVKNSRVLLQGALQGQVDLDGSTWTIENERITLTLCKANEMTWQTVVRGDSRGEMVDSPEQIDAIHSRLADITSEEWNPDPKLMENRPYNSQELEECDAFAEDSAVLQRIDGDTHSVTHQANISSHQWLFNVQTRPDTLPAVCLRHDVDGVVWQPLTPSGATEGQGSIFKHHATFNAFGYVQASKQQRRFCAAPPDMSYVVIADCVRHVYIYRQPSPILSPIRNRKTGRQVNAIAKQQLVSLEAVTDILGIHATNDRLYLLAGNIFHVVKVN